MAGRLYRVVDRLGRDVFTEILDTETADACVRWLEARDRERADDTLSPAEGFGPYAVLDDTYPRTQCEWFVGCDRTAIGNVVHPVLGNVPTCGECATRLGLDLVPFGATL